jgi:ABC-2 type transport system permease protein
VTETLRALAGGHVTAAGLSATVAWCVALLALFGGLALRMQRRTQ